MTFPINKLIRESLYPMSQNSRQLLTNLAADLCSCLTNYRNITDQHMPTVNSYIYLPDRIQYKHVDSLSRALSRIILITDRSVSIHLPLGKIVNHHFNDIISCELNDNSMIFLDILDFLLYDYTEELELQQHESQFGLNIPNLTADHVSHGKDLEPHVTPAHQEDSATEVGNNDEPLGHDTGNELTPLADEPGYQSQATRRSNCSWMPSREFLEMFQ